MLQLATCAAVVLGGCATPIELPRHHHAPERALIVVCVLAKCKVFLVTPIPLPEEGPDHE